MRISRHQMFMEIAHVVAKRSTCFRANVGAIAVLNGRQIVGIGYNGAPPGEDHCAGNECDYDETKGCLRSIHAEANLLNRLGDFDTDGISIYTSMMPCPSCAELIVEYQIAEVYFGSPYREDRALHIIGESNTNLFRVLPCGTVISPYNFRVIENG